MQLGGLSGVHAGDDQATGCFQHIYVRQETIVDKAGPDKPHKNPCWDSFLPWLIDAEKRHNPDREVWERVNLMAMTE